MTHHIAIIENPRIWDGYGLTKEIHDWLKTSIGGRVHDMTALRWNKRSRWFLRTNHSRSDLLMTDNSSGPRWLHFYFAHPSHAMLFKLTWCGNV